MPLRSSLFEVTGVLFLIVCLLCIRLLRRRSLLLLLVWPVLIYFWGPTITSLFANAPVLRRYVFMSSLIPETLLMFIYVAGLCCLDYFFNLSHSIRKCVSSPSVVGLARSPIFLPIYLATTALAVTLQLVILHRFGSALGGGPYVMSLVSEGYIPYWGFLAGLYEIIFLFVVLYLLSGQRSRLRFLVLGLYVFAAALRLAGGTRLILVKEIAVILIIAHAQGRIKTRKLLLTGALVVVLGSVVGLLRSSGANPFAFLGPIYGLVMESGLNALTLNIAYQVQHSVYMAISLCLVVRCHSWQHPDMQIVISSGRDRRWNSCFRICRISRSLVLPFPLELERDSTYLGYEDFSLPRKGFDLCVQAFHSIS